MLAENKTTISSSARLLIVVAVMSATLMQVLDMTIVNVALPHMQGTLSASPDQISWTLTSYLVAAAIFMPITGYFSDRFGRRKYLLFSILGFTVASACCGASQTLPEIIVFRLLQGVFGASLVPLSQAIIADVYPAKDLGKAMAIWGAGVMVGPILGPTLGGYLTEIASWRWTFYINVPVGIFAFFLALKAVPESQLKKRSFDLLGFILIAVTIGAFQYFLDRGNSDDWFNAGNIRLAALISIVGLVAFVAYNRRTKKQAIFDTAIFKNYNFSIASIIMIISGLGLFGTMVILPLFLEGLLNYPVFTTGLVLAPRGICSMIGMIIVGRFSTRVDPKILLGIGILLNVMSMFIWTGYSQNVSFWSFVWPQLIQGFGLGLIFVPLSTMAFTTLSREARNEAAGLFSLIRTLGSSIGIAVAMTLYTRHIQIAWNNLAGFVTPYSTALKQYLQPLHLHANAHLGAAIIGNEIAKQAQMISFINVTAITMWSFIIMLPMIFLLKRYQAIK